MDNCAHDTGLHLLRKKGYLRRYWVQIRKPKIVYGIQIMYLTMQDNQSANEDLKLNYIIISRDAKQEKKCTLHPLRGRSDFSFRTRKNPGEFAPDSILFFPEGEPLNKELASEIKIQVAKDTKELNIVLIDSRWKKTKGILDSLPQIRRVSLEGYVTGAVRRDPPPQGGLASVEALYLASLLFGKPDLTLFDSYHFRERFMMLNGLTL